MLSGKSRSSDDSAHRNADQHKLELQHHFLESIRSPAARLVSSLKRERGNIKVLLFCRKREQEGWTCLPIKILNNPRHSCTNEQFPSQDNRYIFKIIKEICHHQEENDSSTTKLTSMEYYGLCGCVRVCGCVCVCVIAQSCLTPWTVAHQAPLSMEFSRQEYWSGLPFPSPGDLPDPGVKPRSPAFQVDSLLSE